MATKKTARKTTAQGLSREQIDEVLTILKDVNSVELKLVAPADKHRATIGKLGLDPIDAEVRQVYFFDTPEPRPEQGRPGRARQAHRRRCRRYRRQAATGRSGHDQQGAASLGKLQDGSRCGP